MASMMDAAAAVKKGAPFCHVYDFDATSACLLWSTIAKAPCYTLQMRVVTEGGGFPQWKTLSASVKGQRVRKNKLDADKAYEFRVAAMVENVTTKSTFTLGTQQDKDALKAGAYSAPALLQKRSAPALAAPVVFDADGDSATVTWSGGSPPFALQYALADDEAALGVNGGGPWKLAAARINGHVARKKNLQSGKKYAWRVKESDAPNCAWSRACDESPIPVPHAFMPRVFGEFLADKGGAKRPTGIALAGKVVAVYAGASWDDGSNEFEPRLAKDYAALKAAGVLTKAEKKAQGPKRPLSAYMHFCAERRPSLTEELKAQLGAEFKYTLVMTKLGEEWRGVGDKSKYEAMAAADKASKAA